MICAERKQPKPDVVDSQVPDTEETGGNDFAAEPVALQYSLRCDVPDGDHCLQAHKVQLYWIEGTIDDLSHEPRPDPPPMAVAIQCVPDRSDLMLAICYVE